MGKWCLIDKEDISTEAQEILAEVYMIKKYTKSRKKLLGWYTEKLLEDLDEKETEKAIKALQELKDKRYINCEFVRETKRDRENLIKTLVEETGEDCKYYSHLLHTDGDIIGIRYLKIKLKAWIYVKTCMEYDAGLEIRIRKKTLTVECMLRQLSENGIYIVIIAVIPILCAVIDTILNAINTFR